MIGGIGVLIYMLNVYQQINRNKWRSYVVIAGFIGFSTLVLLAVGQYTGNGQSYLLPAVAFSALTGIGSYWYADKIILAISKARMPNPLEEKTYVQVAGNIAMAAGLPPPRLFVIDDSAPNAFATGRDPKNAVVCVTTGLLSKLNRTELEGVVAHEISHIQHFDTRLMMVVTVLIGSIALLSDWLIRLSWGHRDSDRKNESGILGVLGFLLIILSPIIGQLIQLALSRQREFYADAGSAMLTRQPSGLISALGKISADSEPLEVANKATANLYIINPFKSNITNQSLSKMANLFNTHPPVAERIKELESML